MIFFTQSCMHLKISFLFKMWNNPCVLCICITYTGVQCLLPFHENALLLNTFDLKHFTWWFVCLLPWSEAEAIKWHHSAFWWNWIFLICFCGSSKFVIFLVDIGRNDIIAEHCRHCTIRAVTALAFHCYDIALLWNCHNIAMTSQSCCRGTNICNIIAKT